MYQSCCLSYIVMCITVCPLHVVLNVLCVCFSFYYVCLWKLPLVNKYIIILILIETTL